MTRALKSTQFQTPEGGPLRVTEEEQQQQQVDGNSCVKYWIYICIVIYFTIQIIMFDYVMFPSCSSGTFTIAL